MEQETLMERVHAVRVVNATKGRYALTFWHCNVDLRETRRGVSSRKHIVHVLGHVLDIFWRDQTLYLEKSLFVESAIVYVRVLVNAHGKGKDGQTIN